MLRGLRAMMRQMHACSASCLAPRAVPQFQSIACRSRRKPLSFSPCTSSLIGFKSSTSVCVAAAAVKDADKPTPPDSTQQATRQRLSQLLQLKLPSYCCGCGVKLQQEDPDGPGYFQVPRRLIELAEEQTHLVEGEGVSAEERERRSTDWAMEAWLDEQQRPAVPAAAAAAAGDDDAEPAAAIKCARCYSLVHYGKVTSEAAEGLLPEFDLGKKVGRKIALQKDRQALVLCVVDVWDFDGSLPRAALTSLFPGASQPADAPIAEQGLQQQQLPFQLAIAVNKFDLLPSQATPKRVEQWVRARLRQGGLPRPSRVFMVSALNGVGVKDLVRTLKDDMAFRADLWVVGAQNAGKSSLINAMKKLGGTGGRGEPTVAPVPGTTLGLLRVPGIPLGPKHRTFDTPGVPHPYQLTAHLTLDETAAVLPRRRLKPRTYRIPEGSTILIGGLARVDVVKAPSATMYVTVYVSDEIVTHLGKTPGADERRRKHTGGLLVPPYEAGRAQELELVPRTAVVEGSSWQQHTRDIAIAGLGWISVGVEGTAELAVWVPQGVMVTMHDALIPDYAKVFQKPGFSNMLPSTGGRQQGMLTHSSGINSRKRTMDPLDLDIEEEDGENEQEPDLEGVPVPAATAAGDGLVTDMRQAGGGSASNSSSRTIAGSRSRSSNSSGSNRKRRSGASSSAGAREEQQRQ